MATQQLSDAKEQFLNELQTAGMLHPHTGQRELVVKELDKYAALVDHLATERTDAAYKFGFVETLSGLEEEPVREADPVVAAEPEPAAAPEEASGLEEEPVREADPVVAAEPEPAAAPEEAVHG